MSRKCGRPQRHYRIRVRTERRDPIDYAKLAQAALEQAAMDTRDGDASSASSQQTVDCPEHQFIPPKESPRERLA